MKTRFLVTITDKFPAWNSKPWTVEVRATSKADANKRARKELEAAGHRFTHSDAVTMKAEPITGSDQPPAGFEFWD